MDVFPDAVVDDGLLDVAVMTAEGPVQVARTLVRTAVSDPQKSPFVRRTKMRKLTARLDRAVRYEVDGGDRSTVRKFTVVVEPRAVTVRVPRAG